MKKDFLIHIQTNDTAAYKAIRQLLVHENFLFTLLHNKLIKGKQNDIIHEGLYHFSMDHFEVARLKQLLDALTVYKVLNLYEYMSW